MSISSDRRVRLLFHYGAAIAFIGAMVLACQRLPPDEPLAFPLLVLLVAVLGSGILGGHGPVVLAAALGMLSAYTLFIPPAWQLKVPDALDITALVVFAAASALAAWGATARQRAAAVKAQCDTIAGDLAIEARRRRALSEVTSHALAASGVEVVCRDAAGLTAAALGCEHGLVLELGADSRSFAIAGASGWDAHVLEGLAIDAGIDTQAGYAVYARDPIAVGDGETRFTIPAALRARGIRSGLAARMGTALRPFGVIVVYSTSARTFTEADGDFLVSVATALAGLYERRRLDAERADLASRDAAQRATADVALRRAAFLAQTATVLDSALEPEATLVSLARLAVPALADCAIVDLVHEDGQMRRIDVVDIDPTRREATQAIRRIPPMLRGDGPFARAIRTGQPVLLSDAADKPDQDAERTTVYEQERLMIRAANCESLLLIPLVARGQSLGLLTLGARPPKQYGTADLSLAQELAARAAIALDNARLYREAQAASRAKDEFLATVSHELRSPINAVLGWAAMLRNHQLEPSRADYACEAIERSARAQAQLLEQLLDVSRIVSGKLELRLSPVHVESIVEAAVDTVRPTAETRKVRIGARMERGVPLLMADPERLQQVVINLVSNAVKFSPDGGLVQIELRRVDGFAQIVVSDQGIGIRSDLLPHVFDRLRQGTPPGTMNQGLGLGLWIVRDIVERHGGSVIAASPGEGKGATFTVTLPLWSQPEPIGATVRDASPTAG